MNAGLIVQAVGLFAVTNIDDIVVLSLFFAQGAGRHGSATRVVTGQYVGFLGILVVAVAAALGATLLPGDLIPYLWCVAGRFFATRPLIVNALSRWGHVLLPVVLICLGLLILI